MSTFYANASCSPWTPKNEICEVGGYVQYAVNVSTATDVATTLGFARTNKIRLVIRNTGHEYAGHFLPDPPAPQQRRYASLY